MKRVRINIGYVGLVYRKQDYVQVLTAGVHWVHPLSGVECHSMALPFTPVKELNVYLKDPKLTNLLQVVSVGDNEFVLKFKNGNFKEVLMPGRYAYWKGDTQFEFQTINLDSFEIPDDLNKNLLEIPAILAMLRVFAVMSYEKGYLLVEGKVNRSLDPGTYLYLKNNQSLSVLKADMRKQQMEVSGQEILTKDKAALRINYFVQYQVEDLNLALIQNKYYEKQLHILSQMAVREYVGAFSLDELLEQKQSIAEQIGAILYVKAKDLGVSIKDCGVRDVILPGDMKEIMNQVLMAQKKAQANIITRREETASTRSLLNTAKLMEENSMLFKLKEMEYVEKIADKINTITLSGGGQIIDQLKHIFTPGVND